MIRPSGGRAYVKVEKRDVPRFIPKHIAIAHGIYRGDWIWRVPRPKGHPKPPPLDSLSGVAHTMEQAVADGLERLRELYGETLND